jgi:hypothetical protein
MKTNLFIFATLLFGLFSCSDDNIISTSSEETENRSVSGVTLVPLNGNANGYTYTDLHRETVKWEFGHEIATGPFADPDGSFAQDNQPLDGIFMLASNFGPYTERDITISKDDYIFYQTMGNLSWEYLNSPCRAPKANNPWVNKENAIAVLGQANIITTVFDYLTVNGQPLTSNPLAFRVKTAFFDFDVHPDFNGSCAPEEQTVHAISDAFAYLVKLAPGEYDISFDATMKRQKWNSSGTWHITVTE